MAGAALVQKAWPTMPAETQKLARLPSVSAVKFVPRRRSNSRSLRGLSYRGEFRQEVHLQLPLISFGAELQ